MTTVREHERYEYTSPKLEDKAKERCAHCFALTERQEIWWCDEGDCDITAVLNCKEWEDEDIGRIK